jgi:hypothetical protein
VPQTVLVTRMLTHDITSTGAVEGVPSGAPPRTRFQIICWSTIAKTPYRAPKGERGERAGGARGYPAMPTQTAAIIMMTRAGAQVDPPSEL